LKQIVVSYDGCELLYLFESSLSSSSSSNHPSVYDIDVFELNIFSSGARTLTLFASNVEYPRHKDIHRHTPAHCSLAILIFNQFHTKEIEPWLFDTIIPRYGPIIRKDEDHFIFITPTGAIADKVMLSNNFGEKIKYKIALNVQSSSQPITQTNRQLDYYDLIFVECRTIDFYANDGKPVSKVLRSFAVSQSNQTMQHDVSNLFPDMTKNFNGRMFRITVPNVKYRFEMEWKDGAYRPKRGFYRWWFDEACLKFNFSYYMFWSSYEKVVFSTFDVFIPIKT